jgi:hypothetical protein
MHALILLVGIAATDIGPKQMTVCDATKIRADGEVVRVVGTITHSVEIASYLNDRKCGGLIVLDSGTADKSFDKADRLYTKFRQVEVLLEGQLVKRPGNVGWLYRYKLIRVVSTKDPK